MKNQNGFVYIDALVAISFAAVILFSLNSGVLNAYNNAISNVSVTENYNQGIIAAQQVTENLKTNKTILDLKSAVKSANNSTININNKNYTMLVSDPIQVNNTAHLYQVDITASWTNLVNKQNINRTLKITRYYYAE